MDKSSKFFQCVFHTKFCVYCHKDCPPHVKCKFNYYTGTTLCNMTIKSVTPCTSRCVCIMQRTARTRWMISGTTSMIIVCISFVRRLSLPIRHICCFIGDVWHRHVVRCRSNSGPHLSAVHLTATRHPTVSFKILMSFCTISLVMYIFLYLDKMYHVCYVIKRNFVSVTKVKPRLWTLNIDLWTSDILTG